MSSSEQQLDSVFAALDDFELCDRIHGAIEEHYGYENIVHHGSEIPTDRRAIHFVWGVGGFLECNGYAYFWGVDIDHWFYAEAFGHLGIDWIGEKVAESLQLIADPEVLGDYHAVTDYFGSKEAKLAAAEPYQEYLFDRSEDIQRDLARFIRRERYGFLDLLPLIQGEGASQW